MVETQEQLLQPPVDWENETAVEEWLQDKIRPATNGIVCIDERDTQVPLAFISTEDFLDASFSSDAAARAPKFEAIDERGSEGSVREVVKHEGYLRIPGGDFGVAAIIERATGVGAETAVDLAYAWGAENGREGFNIHTDNHGNDEEGHIGCGFMKLVKTQPDLFGLSQQQGEGLFDATQALPSRGKIVVKATYTGTHQAGAVIVNASPDHTFTQRDERGEAFVVGTTRAHNAFSNPDTGLAAFLRKNGVNRPQNELSDNLAGVFDRYAAVAASILAPNKPVYEASVVEIDGRKIAKAKMVGRVQPLAA